MKRCDVAAASSTMGAPAALRARASPLREAVSVAAARHASRLAARCDRWGGAVEPEAAHPGEEPDGRLHGVPVLGREAGGGVAVGLEFLALAHDHEGRVHRRRLQRAAAIVRQGDVPELVPDEEVAHGRAEALEQRGLT